MLIPAERWYNSIPVRKSRRQYDGRPIPADVLSSLQATCADFRPFPSARAVLITQPPDDIFRGILGSYGKVKGAVGCIVFIGNMTDPEVQAKTGYTGEGIILEATALGLGTCWVGGFFRKDVATKVSGVKTGETVLAITPIGFAVANMTTEERLLFGRSHPRKPLTALINSTAESARPLWVDQALEAARLAPSATNRQPWRFDVDASCITISTDKMNVNFGVSKRLDCGIAMLHIEVATLHAGIQGTWEFLKKPQVARFIFAPPVAG